MEGLIGGQTGFLFQGIEEKILKLWLIAVDEDVVESQQPTCLFLEVHDDLLVDGMGSAFTVVDVGEIDQSAFAAGLGSGINNIMVIVPDEFRRVGFVLVVE